MSEVSATDASRRFADLLDGVEFRSEHYTIVRRGRVVARLVPAHHGSGAATKALLRRHHIDTEWSGEIDDLRNLLTTEERF